MLCSTPPPSRELSFDARAWLPTLISNAHVFAGTLPISCAHVGVLPSALMLSPGPAGKWLVSLLPLHADETVISGPLPQRLSSLRSLWLYSSNHPSTPLALPSTALQSERRASGVGTMCAPYPDAVCSKSNGKCYEIDAWGRSGHFQPQNLTSLLGKRPCTCSGTSYVSISFFCFCFCFACVCPVSSIQL